MVDTLIFDIEGDALYEDVSKVHCAWVYSTKYKEWEGFEPHKVHKLGKFLEGGDVICGHNIQGYDLPTLTKIFGDTFTKPVFDTMVTARLWYPDLLGGHSLKAWGKRLGVYKGEVSEEEPDDSTDVWELYTPEMYDYCKQDVEVTLALFNHMADKGFAPNQVIEERIYAQRPAYTV